MTRQGPRGPRWSKGVRSDAARRVRAALGRGLRRGRRVPGLFAALWTLSAVAALALGLVGGALLRGERGGPPAPQADPSAPPAMVAAVPTTPAVVVARAPRAPAVPLAPAVQAPREAAAPDGRLPAWRRFAVAATDGGDERPRIAVVVDDLGLNRTNAWRMIALPAPLTLAFMTYADDLPAMTAAAREAGHELMLHVPMQPLDAAQDTGPNALSAELPEDELRRRLTWGLKRFEGYVGINNHMGSRFTAERPGMRLVMGELKARGLLFLDSRTTGGSVGEELARDLGVPTAGRDVFLDNELDRAAIDAQLARVEAIARRHGSAIAIGHPHDVTVEALAAWLPGLAARGFRLVPVSAVVEARRQLAQRGGESG